MDFKLTDEQEQLLQMTEQFARNELAPLTEEMDEKEEWWPKEIQKKMADLNLIGIYFPEEYGGLGLGATEMLLAKQGTARGGTCMGSILSWGANDVIGSIGILKFGTEEQKRKYLPKIASADMVAAFALTEPDAGSDAASIRCRAERKGDHYVLNGTKMFITNGPICDVVTVIAVTDPSKGSRGISAFLVEKDMPGFSSGKKLKKMGMRSSPTSELIFDNCIVPVENRLGQEGDGFNKVARGILEWERCAMGSILGVMEYNLEQCRQHVLQRVQFKQPIGNFQAVRHRMAEMRIDIEATRWLVYWMAWLIDNDMTPAPVEASIAKAFLAQSLNKNTSMAVSMFGGYGVCREYPVQRSYRDCKVIEIGGGTEDIQKNIIALGVLGFPQKRTP